MYLLLMTISRFSIFEILVADFTFIVPCISHNQSVLVFLLKINHVIVVGTISIVFHLSMMTQLEEKSETNLIRVRRGNEYTEKSYLGYAFFAEVIYPIPDTVL